MAENKPASFEASLSRLEQIVEELQSDAIDLERSVELFKEGRALVKSCETQLSVAESTLKALDAAEPAAPPSQSRSAGFDEDAALEDEIPF